MKWIIVHHPKTGGEGKIAESAWPAHEAKGWKKGPAPKKAKESS